MIDRKEEDILRQVIIVVQHMHSLIFTFYNVTDENEPASTFEKLATFLSWILVVILFPFSLLCCYVKVNEFQRALIFRLGRVKYKLFNVN